MKTFFKILIFSSFLIFNSHSMNVLKRITSVTRTLKPYLCKTRRRPYTLKFSKKHLDSIVREKGFLYANKPDFNPKFYKYDTLNKFIEKNKIRVYSKGNNEYYCNLRLDWLDKLLNGLTFKKEIKSVKLYCCEGTTSSYQIITFEDGSTHIMPIQYTCYWALKEHYEFQSGYPRGYLNQNYN